MARAAARAQTPKFWEDSSDEDTPRREPVAVVAVKKASTTAPTALPAPPAPPAPPAFTAPPVPPAFTAPPAPAPPRAAGAANPRPARRLQGLDGYSGLAGCRGKRFETLRPVAVRRGASCVAVGNALRAAARAAGLVVDADCAGVSAASADGAVRVEMQLCVRAPRWHRVALVAFVSGGAADKARVVLCVQRALEQAGLLGAAAGPPPSADADAAVRRAAAWRPERPRRSRSAGAAGRDAALFLGRLARGFDRHYVMQLRSAAATEAARRSSAAQGELDVGAREALMAFEAATRAFEAHATLKQGVQSDLVPARRGRSSPPKRAATKRAGRDDAPRTAPATDSAPELRRRTTAYDDDAACFLYEALLAASVAERDAAAFRATSTIAARIKGARLALDDAVAAALAGAKVVFRCDAVVDGEIGALELARDAVHVVCGTRNTKLAFDDIDWLELAPTSPPNALVFDDGRTRFVVQPATAPRAAVKAVVAALRRAHQRG